MARRANKKQKVSKKEDEPPNVVEEESPKDEEKLETGENATPAHDREAGDADDQRMGDEDGIQSAMVEAPERTQFISDGRYRNKQRCLVLCSRGVTARYRHVLEDLRNLMPHHKKESKLDPGADGAGRAVNDILQMRSCNSVLFLECRKKQDCYMWLGLAGGPSARFHVSNVHTMDELRLTGNCMKGSRPILSFDESFKRFGHLKILKELFVDVFGTPRGHPKSKPFVDRVLAFYYADKKVSYSFVQVSSNLSMITPMMSVYRTVLAG
jgi:ribosome biogenesis protein BRX1